jgi:CheY-like chemotaxis protein
VKLELSPDDEDQLRVVIQDEGVGFDSEQLADSHNHPAFGLFNVRERLALLGGRFEIESAVGQGSRFVLVAPRYSVALDETQGDESETADTVTINSAAVARAVTPGRSNQIRVLVVDDHAVMRQGLCSLLAEEDGVEVVGEASDGIGAIQRARELEPDIVLMDYSLPGMTGAEATHVIRREFPNVQVIALSMHREKERAEAMIAAGAVAYLNKSGDSEVLIKAIAKCGFRTASRSQ